MGSPFATGTATITHDQIISDAAPLFELIPDPGAGKIIIPTVIVVTPNFIANYSNIATDAQVTVYVGNVGIGIINENDWSFFEPGEKQTYVFMGGGAFDTSAETCFPLFFNASNRAPGALKLRLNNQSSGPLEGGDSANTITVRASYIIA